jgi:hypothetical protein
MRNISDGSINGVTPDGYDKHGPYYSVNKIKAIAIKGTQNGVLIPRKDKAMSIEINKATDVVESATEKFNKVFESLVAAEIKAAAEARKVSGNIRKAADDLASGLLKVQKTADFSMLDRQVSILERAANALTILSELDKTGRLENLMRAMK